MNYNIMSMSHRRAKALKKSGDKRSYRKLLSLSLRAVNMMYRECTNADISYLKAMQLDVNLKLLKSLHHGNTYSMNFGGSGKAWFCHKFPSYAQINLD